MKELFPQESATDAQWDLLTLAQILQNGYENTQILHCIWIQMLNTKHANLLPIGPCNKT